MTLQSFILSPFAFHLFQRLAYSFLNNRIGLFLFIHVIERDEVMLFAQQVLMLSISLSHQPAQVISLHGVLKE